VKTVPTVAGCNLGDRAMHRQTTTFSRRVNRVFTHRADRVAKAVERRGIRATYELHDHLLSNRKSRGLYEADPPTLDAVQQTILGQVEESGFAVVPFGDLFTDPAEWSALEAMRDRFVSETEQDLAKGGEHVRVRAGKEFVVRLHSYGVDLGLDDPWFRAVASHRLLDIANTYLEMWSKLEYIDVWYSVPQPADATRISSQRWHRDYNDKHLLKVFLYLVDVDENMGPFQYVPGSQPGGPYADAWPWEPLGNNYPTEEELETLIPDSAIEAFVASKGTLIFCNTAGFHRGGFSTTNPRVLATATYSSPASLASLTTRSYGFTGSLDALDASTRHALS
jgi:ectoine hydroxylase-related dioxygenase (phytanoyl-CoA dioxygenase family)